MTIAEIIKKFETNSSYLTNGAGSLARNFKCTVEDIKKAKKFYYNQTNKSMSELLEDDKVVKKLVSPKPLTPIEIEVLTGVDNISTYVARVWEKLQTNGDWTYSIDVRYKIKDFYDKKKLELILINLCKKEIKPFKRDNKLNSQRNTLVVNVSDDHLGIAIQNGSYDTFDYQNRLKVVSTNIIREKYNELLILSLGDQLNGWHNGNNQITTRGHILGSGKSNKEQFLDYIESRKVFYDNIFSSNCANIYKIVEVNLSNHSGLDFSFMANEWLKLYVKTKYPFVEFINSEDLITKVTLKTKHILFACHGKDDKYQKTPLPLNLDSKTESYFTAYILEQGVNPKANFVTVIKGDSHRYSESEGKSFRYVSVPSIADGSDWQRVNFGVSKPGVLIEIFTEGQEEPWKKVIRFNK